MMSDDDRYLKRAILDIIKNQLRDDDPPETRQTLERLMTTGYSRQEALERIGAGMVEMIRDVWHDRKDFDRKRYKALLNDLE